MNRRKKKKKTINGDTFYVYVVWHTWGIFFFLREIQVKAARPLETCGDGTMSFTGAILNFVTVSSYFVDLRMKSGGRRDPTFDLSLENYLRAVVEIARTMIP